MKVINLIRAQIEPIFGETFYFINVHDEQDPFHAGRTLDEQYDFGDRFQAYFESFLKTCDFWSILALTPYFSWTDEYWDMDFTFRHAIEKRPEYEVERMSSFYQRFDFRENQLADDMLQRLSNGLEASATLNDEILLTYFPNTNSSLHELYDDEINASLREKIEEVASLESANAQCNIITLMDKDYTDESILGFIFEKLEQLPLLEKDIVREKVMQTSIENPITRYWK